MINRSRRLVFLGLAAVAFTPTVAVASPASPSHAVVAPRPGKFVAKHPLAPLRRLKAQGRVDARDLVKLLGEKNASTAGHARRVGHYAKLIAKELGFSKRHVAQVQRYGFLHDMGKLLTPNTVLNKPGRLTEREFKVMRHHTDRGAAILRATLSQDSAENRMAVKVAKYHHKRPDGKGYPANPMAKKVPLEAKIVAVADVYDAMTSQRSYNVPKTKAQAISVLRAIAGTQLNAKVVKAFLRVAKRLPESNGQVAK